MPTCTVAVVGYHLLFCARIGFRLGPRLVSMEDHEPDVVGAYSPMF